MIETKDISVIIQGALNSKTITNVTQSIRKYLPQAEIIVSSWEGTDLSGVDFDISILSQDIGAYKSSVTGITNNCARQILSTQKGLEFASRPYTLKIRSDLVLTDNKFLKFYNDFPERDNDYIFFNERVMFVSCFFKKYIGQKKNYLHPVPYHISDWLMFGKTSDIKKLFDIPHDIRTSFYQYFDNMPKGELRGYCFREVHKLTPEQYILVAFLEKNFPNKYSKYRNLLDFNSENIYFFEKFVASNCIILDTEQFGIFCSKNNGVDPYRTWSKNSKNIPYQVWEGLYSHYEFLLDYKKYCDSSFSIPLKEKIKVFKRLIKNKKVIPWMFYR